MMPFAALALGTNLVMVAADRVPKLNVEPSCKTAGVEGMALGRTTQSISVTGSLVGWTLLKPSSRSEALARTIVGR